VPKATAGEESDDAEQRQELEESLQDIDANSVLSEVLGDGERQQDKAEDRSEKGKRPLCFDYRDDQGRQDDDQAEQPRQVVVPIRIEEYVGGEEMHAVPCQQRGGSVAGERLAIAH
jgi:hypothetical protein